MPTKCKRTGEDRRTWRESENHIIDKLNNERGIEFDTQVSYKDRKPGGGVGSTRPDGFHKGPPPTSIEIKNYNNMKTNLKKTV